MSKPRRILMRDALAAAVACWLVPKAHEACRVRCGSACGHTTGDATPDTTMREVRHAA